MNKSIEKKLLHFFTGGNIQEDFAASRKRKTSKLRQLIRACFYAHFAAAVICITLAAVLRAGTGGIVAVSLCEVLLLGLAFLAVGDMTLIKTLLCCGDTAFTAAMFVTGALLSNDANKAPFFAVGAISVVTTLCALTAYYAAMCREFLDNFSPLAIRREHYTLLPQLAGDAANKASDDAPDEDSLDDTFEDSFEDKEALSEDSSADAPEEYKPKPAPPPAPPKTEIQLLADKLREILCAPKTDSVADAMPKNNTNNQARKPQAESAPVIPEAPEYPNIEVRR